MPSALSVSVDEIADTTSGDLSVEKSTDKTLPGENALAQSLYQTDEDNAQLDAILAPLAVVTAATSTAITNAIGTTSNGGVWFADFADFSFPTLTSSISGIDCSTACSGSTGALPICVRITIGGRRVWYGKMTSPVTSTTKGAGCFYTFSAVTDASTEAALFDGTESHLVAGTWDYTNTAKLQLDMISASTKADSNGILNTGTRSVLTETNSASTSINTQPGKSSSTTVRTANVNGRVVDNGESKTVTVIGRWNASTVRADLTIAGNSTIDLDGCFVRGTTTSTSGCLSIDDVTATTFVALTTVAASASPPSVTATSPASGATGVVLNPSISVTFSEAMDVSSITANTYKLTNSGGTSVSGTITTTSTTATLTPTTLLTASTTYTATVTNAIADTSGTPLNATYAWTFTTGTEVDSTVPSIASTSPTSGATRVAVNTAVAATFSEAINSSTVTTSSFTLAPTSGGSNVASTVGTSGTTSTLTPTSNLSYSTSYTATLSTAVQDQAGNALSAAASWAFTTIGESGKFDPLFSSNGWYSESFSTTANGFDQWQATVVDSAGDIYAVGTAYNGTNQDILVVRFNSDGSLDTSFSSDGYDRVNIGGNDYANGVALQSDQKIIVAGYTDNGASERNFVLLRYAPNGDLDTNFDGDGIAQPDFSGSTDADTAYDLVINSSDQAIVAGQIAGRAGLARFTTVGALDTSFATNGLFSDADYDFFYDVVIDGDGKILAVGEDAGATSDVVIARFSAAGALDTSYSVDGRVAIDVGSSTNDQALGAALQSDGKLVVIGHTNRSSTAEDCLVLRLGTTGSLDTDFGTSGIFQFGNDSGGEVQDICYGVGIHSGGRIVVSGASAGQTILARLTSSGALNTTFDTDGLALFTEGSGGLGLILDSNGDYVGVGSNSDGGTNTFILRVIQ